MNTRYTALPILSLALKILGYLVLILGILTSLYYLFFGIAGAVQLPEGMEALRGALSLGILRGHIVPAFWALFDAAVRGILLLGAAELIHVFLDIEDNTRRSADLARNVPPTPNL